VFSKNPLPLTKPREPARFEPYIYTNQDMQPADRRRRFTSSLRLDFDPYTVRTLCCCSWHGLRISEALRLNLTTSMSRTESYHSETKFFKSPLRPCQRGSRRGCESTSTAVAGRTQNVHSTLLRTQEYERIKRQTAELVFKRLREKAGVARSSTARYQPRLHDFRHTFAVVAAVTWYPRGQCPCQSAVAREARP